MMKTINLPELECKRCGHRWTPRKETVKICPNCKSENWDIEKEKRQE